jgi:hypothetical protein
MIHPLLAILPVASIIALPARAGGEAPCRPASPHAVADTIEQGWLQPAT